MGMEYGKCIPLSLKWNVGLNVSARRGICHSLCHVSRVLSIVAKACCQPWLPVINALSMMLCFSSSIQNNVYRLHCLVWT